MAHNASSPPTTLQVANLYNFTSQTIKIIASSNFTSHNEKWPLLSRDFKVNMIISTLYKQFFAKTLVAAFSGKRGSLNTVTNEHRVQSSLGASFLWRYYKDKPNLTVNHCWLNFFVQFFYHCLSLQIYKILPACIKIWNISDYFYIYLWENNVGWGWWFQIQNQKSRVIIPKGHNSV